MGWLEDFVAFTRHGEAPEKLRLWTGVSTIAGALQRKVFLDMGQFEWSPNFYILLVGPAGAVKKSTSVDLGMDLLNMAGVKLGPSSATWQRLVQYMGEEHSTAIVDGQEFLHASVTLALSEFGQLFKPKEQELVDTLTALWDGKRGVFSKQTKTNGNDELENPWINVIAGVTPDWIAENFPAKLIGSGFGSRPVYVYVEKPSQRIAYPIRQAPKTPEWFAQRDSLVERLRVMTEYAGGMQMTEEAYVWGEAWYDEYGKQQDRLGTSLEASFGVRLQTHLHKLAMVIACSDGDFPNITEVHLQKADALLQDLREDSKQIFGAVGQSPITTAAAEIEKILKRGPCRKQALYGHFSRRMDIDQFNLALKSAIASGSVIEVGAIDDPQLELRK